jgi:hypothetical protein
MANALFSSDGIADKHYQHSAFTTTIADSYATGGFDTSPRGLDWDGTNIHSAGWANDRLYKHSGFSATITSSIAAVAANPDSCSWDGGNLYSIDDTNDKAYKHSGFTTTISDSIATPGDGPRGIKWDSTGGNLYTGRAVIVNHKFYKHSGFTTTITSSIASFNVASGLDFDGTDLRSCDRGTDKHYHHSGFTTTVTTSIAAPAAYPYGVGWGAEPGGAPAAIASQRLKSGTGR